MTEEEAEAKVRSHIQGWARAWKKELPPDWGFILFAFPFGGGGNSIYIANAQRDDAVQAMREFIAKVTKDSYATDQGAQGESAFNHWWKTELSRLEATQFKEEELARVRQVAYDAWIAGLVWSA
jgi:hypothetical protein